MRKRLLYLCTAMLVAGAVPASAQTTAYTETPYSDNGKATTVELNLTEFASAFATDTATFAADFRAWQAATKAANKTEADALSMVLQSVVNGGQYVYPDETVGYTANYNGSFWMKADGTVCTWGTEGYAWYMESSLDAMNDKLVLNIGHNESAFTEGGTATANFVWTYNGKSVNIGITYTIGAKPTADVELQFSKLTVVGQTSKDVTQYPAKAWDGGTYVKLSMADLASSLGLSKADLKSTFEARLGVRQFDWDETQLFTDELSTAFTANSPGFWFGKTIAESGEDSPLLAHDTYGSANNVYFVEYIDYTYSDEADTLSFTLGQYPSKDYLTAGTEWTGTFYVLNGAKAYAVNMTLKLVQRDTAGDPNLTTYTKVGEEDVVFKAEINTGYGEVTKVIDAEKIAALLGDEVDNLELWTLSDVENVLQDTKNASSSTNSTGGYNGYWLDKDGKYSAWGSNAAITAVFEKLEDGSYIISSMQMPGGTLHTSDPQRVQLPVYLCSLGKGTYYVLNIDYTLVQEETVPTDQWQYVGTLNYDVQLVPKSEDGQWELDQKTTLDMANIAKLCGTDADKLKIYAYIQDSNGNDSIQEQYNATPYPGFWMSENGKYATGYNGNGAFAMTIVYSTGVMTWYNVPGLRSPGDSYTCTYLMGDPTPGCGKFVKLKFAIDFVETVQEIETVGEEKVEIVLNADNLDADGYWVKTIDTGKLCTALGITAEELESCTWYANNSSSRFQKAPQFIDGVEATGFDTHGAVIDINSEDCVFALGFIPENSQLGASLMGEDPDEEKTLYTTRVAVRYDAKQYVYNVVLSTNTTTGIAGVAAGGAKDGNVYDLSGRVVGRQSVKGLAGGIYILNGKKVLVK